MNILVVDDEKEIADLLEVYLQNEEYQVFKFYDSQKAYQSLDDCQVDLAVIDVMMPVMDGFTLCRKIRERYNFPIIMLTARVEDVDKINGLSIGADDYITKPFNPLEVVARVKAQLRRSTRYNEEVKEEEEFTFQGLTLNQGTHQCTLNGKEISLTPIEFRILWVLMEQQGTVVSSERLFEKVWGDKFLDCNNTVMVHIRRLREKLGEEPRNSRYIKTVWGVGYKIGK